VQPGQYSGHRVWRAAATQGGLHGRVLDNFEIPKTVSNADMLIRSSYLGAAPARSLGSHSCVLMLRQGSTMVGASLEQAVYRAVHVGSNAKRQLATQGLGVISPLNHDEAQLSSDMIDDQIHVPGACGSGGSA